MSEQVRERIHAAIRDHGPIAFDEYMELALYGPGGFYDHPPVGESGHFLTSPHVHPVFADLLRFALDQLRQGLGAPDPFPLVELGAGDGTLARQLLDGYREAGGTRIEYLAVEVSEGARERLASRAIGAVGRVEDLPAALGCAFANELLDNLPFRRFRWSTDGPREIRVGVRDGRLIEVLSEIPPEIGPELPPPTARSEVVLPAGALDLIDGLAPRIAGYLLLIDYGAERAGAVRGYRRHRAVTDVLDDPGSADITAGVDLGAIARRAERHGLRALGEVAQRDALLALGFARWDAGQRERQGRALSGAGASEATAGVRDASDREAIGAWDSRQRARLLLEPAGLGDLRWLLLASPGLPSPPWLERSLRRPSPD